MSDLNKDVNELVTALRVKTEEFGANSAEVKSLVEQHGAVLEKQETKNQELVAEIAAERKAREDVAEQIKDLEVELARKASGSHGVNYKDAEEYKALNMFAAKGIQGIDAEMKSLLRSDSDTQGGYLTDSETSNEIIKKITELSPVRQVARVRSVTRKTLEIPKRESIPTAYWEGEAELGEESSASYGSETITASRLTHIAKYTADLLLSSGFDIESEITSDASEAFSFAEGRGFVVGAGNKQPEGFLVNPDVVSGAYTSESSGTVTGDDLLKLTGELKTGYNPMFAMNRRTLAFVRTLKGANGQYLWTPGLSGSKLNQIAGDDYILMEDMPDISASALSIVYADFARGYQIIDRVGTTVKRDDVTEAAANITRLIFHRYVTGQVVLPEAFKALAIKA